jgi:beta-lactamase class A
MRVHALRFASHFASHPWTPSLTWVVGIGITILIAITVWSLSVVAMWAYPSGRLAPMASVNGTHLGVDDSSRAIAKLDSRELSEHQMTLVISDETHQTTLKNAGIRVAVEATVDKLLTAQQQAKGNLRPWKFWRPRSASLVVNIDDKTFQEFYNSELAQYHKKPVDARLEVKQGNVHIRGGEITWRIDKEALKRDMRRAAAGLDKQVSVAAQQRTPEVKAAELEPLRAEAQQWLDRGFALTYAGETYPIPTSKLAASIMVSKKEKAPQLAINRKPLHQFIKKIAKKDINTDPTPARRILENGQVTRREEGEPGKEVKLSKTLDAVATGLKEGKTTAGLRVRNIKPGTQTTHTYTGTSEGLRALLVNFADSHGGEYGLELRTLNGDIHATYNADKRFVAASTYKMYLAYAAYTEIENDNLAMDKETEEGTVRFCLRKMILYSTNPCAHALGRVIGWKRVDSLLNEAGFGATTLNNHRSSQVNKYTTASDAAMFMRRLRAGALLNGKHTRQLLDRLRSQIFRSGIPSGSSGTVANKVGFFQGYLHDVGIVEGPGRNYVLAIYSYGGQWWEYRQLAQKVENVLTR